jgi:phosphate starvation-inducible protein PhoH and related proteins
MNKKNGEKRTRRRTNTLSASSETNTDINPKPELNELIHFQEPFKCKNKHQKDLQTSIIANDVTICIGPAGTGKSLISIYTALSLLKKEIDKFNNLKLIKSITQLRGEELPSLPGDAMDKMFFQNMSFFDSLHQLIGKKNVSELIEKKMIKFDVIGSFRGRNLTNSIVILDEAQNITYDNLKTILTRLGNNSKLIILGDPEQIDIKKSNSSLSFLVKKIKENPIEGVNIVEFEQQDIVRHRLTSYFINIFSSLNEKEKIIVQQNSPSKKQKFIKKIVLFFKSRFKIFN